MQDKEVGSRPEMLVRVDSYKASDQVRNLVGFHIQSKVPGVQQVHFCIRQVLEKGLCTCRDEGWIVLPPRDQGRRLLFTKPRLPLGIRRDVGPIVVKQVALDLTLDWP